MKKVSFDEFCLATASKDIKLSALRKEILSILFHKRKPMGAYDILEQLKKKRSSAEPPTVYRVLKWLVEVNLIHRIESQNAYVFCSTFHADEASHHNILLICRVCHESHELRDVGVFRSIKTFIHKHKIEIDDSIIEMAGVCAKCLAKKKSG